MSAQIIQIRDFQSKKDLARMYSEQSLEQHALAMASVAFDIGAAGIDLGLAIYETSLGCIPEKDPA